MEKELKDYLRDGETVLWSGRTASFPPLGGQAREQNIFKWGAADACACALLGMYCKERRSHRKIHRAGVLLAVTPWLEQQSILGRTAWSSGG